MNKIKLLACICLLSFNAFGHQDYLAGVARHIRAGTYKGYNSFLWYGQPAAFPENILDLVLDKVKAHNH